MIGIAEAEKALEEKWYLTKAGTGSQILVHYTEESRECKESKTIEKQIRGGTQLSVQDGKKMMVGAMGSTWSQAMLGIDSPPPSDNEESPAPSALGVLPQASGSAFESDQSQSRIQKLRSQGEHERKEKLALLSEEAPAKKKKLSAAEEAAEKAAERKEKAAEKACREKAAKDQQFPHGCVNQLVCKVLGIFKIIRINRFVYLYLYGLI